MGHYITGIIIKGDYDEEQAKEYDLFPISLGYALTMFQTDTYHATYWQYKLKLVEELQIGETKAPPPSDIVIAKFVENICHDSDKEFALIQTDYHGGFGYQYANIFRGTENLNIPTSTINEALRYLGVTASEGKDEFDTVDLCKYRDTPRSLGKYFDLCEELEI